MPEPRVHAGKFITLQPLDIESDIGELFSISHADDAIGALWRYMPNGPFTDADAMRHFLTQWQARPDVVAFTVRSTKTNLCLGSISIMSIRAEHGVAELGNIWYAPTAQRTKANTEACYLLLRHCFDDLHYRRMEWKCDARNESSRAAALRLGFGFEGVFRQHRMVKGENRDTAWFAMLDGEWPQRQVNFEQWLSGNGSVSLTKLNHP